MYHLYEVLVGAVMLILFVVVMTLFSVAWSPAKADDKQIECLAKNIYYEARGLDTVDRIAVAFVTWNRMKSPKYPNTICEVVWQKNQFSWTHDGKSDNPKEKVAWETSQLEATWFIYMMKDYRVYLVDPTKGATHYHADYVTPYWSKKLTKTTQLADHLFYK